MNNKFKAIIIDDEKRARILLSEMLAEYAPHVEVVDTCEDLPHGVKSIRKNKPDLVFLDIEMPGHSGLELLDFFDEGEIDFEIVFTTAYSEYAIKAFKLSAIDYLLKPIDVDELQTALNRYEKKQLSDISNLLALKDNLSVSGHKKIAIPTSTSVKFVDIDTILFLKADSSYTEIYFKDDTKLIVSRTLKNFEEVLDMNTTFFRCHKSYIINFSCVTDYVKADGGSLIMENKSEIPISSEKIQELHDRLNMVKR